MLKMRAYLLPQSSIYYEATRAISATSENTREINPSFYEDPLRLLVNEREGKITEFLNVLLSNQL